MQHKIEEQSYLTLDELPIFNWWQINSGDYTYVFKKKRPIKDKEKSTVLAIYRDLLAQYIKNVGISDDYKRVLRKQKEIASLKLKYVITVDRSLFTEIEIATRELKSMVSGESSKNYIEVKAYVDKYLGFRIDPHSTSVMEYDSYIKLIQKQSSNG